MPTCFYENLKVIRVLHNMRLQNMNFVLIWKHFSCHLLLRLNNHPNLSTYWIMFCASSCDLIIRFQRTSSTVWLSSVLKYFSFQQLHRLTFFFCQVVITKGQNCWQGDILLQWPLTFLTFLLWEVWLFVMLWILWTHNTHQGLPAAMCGGFDTWLKYIFYEHIHTRL